MKPTAHLIRRNDKGRTKPFVAMHGSELHTVSEDAGYSVNPLFDAEYVRRAVIAERKRCAEVCRSVADKATGKSKAAAVAAANWCADEVLNG